MELHSSERDVAYWATSRLTGEWSGLESFAGRLTKEAIEALTSQFTRLDPMIRVRLLLSTVFIPQERLPELRPALRRLADAAVEGDDEWGKVFGLAVGGFDNRLNISAVKSFFPLVQTTLEQLEGEVQKSADAPGFRPLEEMYLTHRLQRARGLDARKEPPQHSHFRLREGAGLAITQNLDEQQRNAESLGASAAAASAATPASRGAAAGANAAEEDMFMANNPVKDTVTIAGLGTVGRIDSSQRRMGRMKQLDVDEAIAAQELSRQMSLPTESAKTPRTSRTSGQTGDDPMATTPNDRGSYNPFFSGDAFVPPGMGASGGEAGEVGGLGSLAMHPPPPPPPKRGREWEHQGGTGDQQQHQAAAPLLRDTLAELGAPEEGEVMDDGMAHQLVPPGQQSRGGAQGDEDPLTGEGGAGNQQVNYF